MPDPEVSYNLALDYLYSHVDYSLKHSSELARADFNLERMRSLMAELGDPQLQYPILHVAGTKGKGSVCALAASGLQAAGYRVGLYTSPHLLDYCERIQLCGVPITHAELARLVEYVKPAVARTPKLTTFEITTAIGMLYFAEQRANAAVIEVGLGGRLDATNVVMPTVTVITSLSYDHMAVLGDTLAKIAGEKAGIIKEGIPVISAPQKEEALEVLCRVAESRNAPFTLVGRDVTFTPLSQSLDGQSLSITGGGKTLKATIPLLGAHQLQNAATAAAALWALRQRGANIDDAAIEAGFARVQWPARFQVVRREPPVILDSAHNQDSFSRLRQALDDYFPGRQVNLVFGASEDKNIAGMFEEIKPKMGRILITRADHPRALPPERISAFAKAANIPYEILTSVKAAFDAALVLAAKDGSIVLTAGSMFVTAEALGIWQESMRERELRNQP
jgi:dihydrofolate synthase / folylpolyglutamate synthase